MAMMASHSIMMGLWAVMMCARVEHEVMVVVLCARVECEVVVVALCAHVEHMVMMAV